MSITRNKILNKILVCGASLVMLASTGAGVVNNVANAKSHHTHINHIYNHRKDHMSNHGYRHSHYLAYRQLIPTIASVYKQLFRSGGNYNNRKLLHKMQLVDNTINHNASYYSHSQIQKLLHNQYSFAISHSARESLQNSLNGNQLITQPQININQHKIHKSHPVNFLPSRQATKGTLAFNQLIPTIKYIRSQIANGASFDNSKLIHKMELVNKTVLQNSSKYSQSQLAQLNSSPYNYDFSKKAQNVISNNLNRFNQQEATQSWSNRGNNSFADQVAQYDYDYINQAREENGLKPLPINGYTQEIANLRSKQYTHDMESHDTNQMENESRDGDTTPDDKLAHGFDYHDTDDDDAYKLGIKDDNGLSENAGSISTESNYSSGDKFGDQSHSEDNTTPQKIAYNDVNDMLNYDRFTGNGHRSTILDKKATGIGVSSYYHSNGVTGQTTEYGANNGGIIQDYSYGNNPTDV